VGRKEEGLLQWGVFGLPMVVELTWLFGAKEFVKSFKEGPKVLIVQSGGNSSGRFLEVAVYRVGGWKGLILILEGREG